MTIKPFEEGSSLLMLENAAFDVVVAENGRAGVTALTKAPVDLAIVDTCKETFSQRGNTTIGWVL